MRWAFLFGLAVALASCAATWSRPGASPADLTKDEAECDYEAKKAVASNNDPVAAGWNEGQLSVACLKMKGWQR